MSSIGNDPRLSGLAGTTPAVSTSTETTTRGTTDAAPVRSTATTADVVESTATAQAARRLLDGTNAATIGPPLAPPADAARATEADTALYAENLGVGLGHAYGSAAAATTAATSPAATAPAAADAPAVSTPTTGAPAAGPDSTQLASDSLAAAFAKVNIVNPDDSVENRSNLIEGLSLLQQQAIRNAQAEIRAAKQALQEAEKDARNWGAVRAYTALAMPHCAVGELFNACGCNKTVSGVLSGSWEQPTIQTLQQGSKDRIEFARTDLEQAQTRWSQALSEFGLHPDSKNFEKWLEEMAQKCREETGSAGQDGVPTKGLTAKLKPKMDAAVIALANIADTQGLEAMIAAAPQIIAEAILPTLKEEGIKNPEAFAEALAAEYCKEVMSRVASGPTASQMLGVSTMLVGCALDPDAAPLPANDAAAAVGQACAATVASLTEAPSETARALQEREDPGQKI